MNEALGQMHAVGAHGVSQAIVRADQQQGAGLAGDGAQALGAFQGVIGAEDSENQGRTGGQGGGHGFGLRSPLGIGEDEKRRQGLSSAPGPA